MTPSYGSLPGGRRPGRTAGSGPTGGQTSGRRSAVDDERGGRLRAWGALHEALARGGGPSAERRGLKPVGELHRATTDARLLLALAKHMATREKRIPGWTARLLRRQEARRAAQDADRAAYKARMQRSQDPPDPDPGNGDGFDRDL